MGYDIQKTSLGYLIERAAIIFPGDFKRRDLVSAIGRAPTFSKSGRLQMEAKDTWGYNHASGILIPGRVVYISRRLKTSDVHRLSLWRILRSEMAESSYSAQNMAYRVLKFRFPHYTPRVLDLWFQNSGTRWRTFEFYLDHIQLNHALIDNLDIIGRTAELARLFGIEFYDVLSRGSQFRVESMLLRLAKPENYLMFSPSRQEVGQQHAPECIPLVMEPMSAFYEDPVIVLDFRSLYPSIIIAYNIW